MGCKVNIPSKVVYDTLCVIPIKIGPTTAGHLSDSKIVYPFSSEVVLSTRNLIVLAFLNLIMLSFRLAGVSPVVRALANPYIFSVRTGFGANRPYSIRRTTTILAVRKDDTVTVIGDGQVTLGSTVVKANARKVRRLGTDKKVIAGFAGATADALTLFDRLETKVDEHPDQLLRACVNLAKDWRMDKYLRRLDATLLVCDSEISLYVTGNGDVLENPDGIIAIGSGSPYAIAAARALLSTSDLSSKDIAQRALAIAADLDIYTNHGFITDSITVGVDDSSSP